MAHVLERHRAMVERLTGRAVEAAGVSDLAIDGRKVSGNSQRRKRRAALVHGTFLLSFDLSLIDAVLPLPARQPAYRAHRTHAAFLMNLPAPAEVVAQALRSAWKAAEPLAPIPHEAIARLACSRYADPAWTNRC
jgi:lipoate-protein ligase A